jgi:hypothetical protein
VVRNSCRPCENNSQSRNNDCETRAVAQQGITATPAYIDFNGKSEFVIDCACFPGSSGSPVLLYNFGGYTDRDGNTFQGPSRIMLIGILYAGPQHTARGEIHVMPIPTSVQPVAISRIPTNLGYCVKAVQLLHFEKHFQQVNFPDSTGQAR